MSLLQSIETTIEDFFHSVFPPTVADQTTDFSTHASCVRTVQHSSFVDACDAQQRDQVFPNSVCGADAASYDAARAKEASVGYDFLRCVHEHYGSHCNPDHNPHLKPGEPCYKEAEVAMIAAMGASFAKGASTPN